GELVEVNAGLSWADRTEPPNAAVIWYQQVDSPSAVANWMLSGLAMPLAVPTFLSAAEKPLKVVGTDVIPAFWKSFVFTVVTRKDESNGIPISLLSTTKVSICGMSVLRPLGLKYLLSGRNQPVFSYSPAFDQSTSAASAKGVLADILAAIFVCRSSQPMFTK